MSAATNPQIPYILTHRVIRPFNGDGSRMLKAGECIDASGWRNCGALERQKYLIPLGPDEAERELKAMRDAASKPKTQSAKPFGNGKGQQTAKPETPPPPATALDAQDDLDEGGNTDDKEPGDKQPPA